MKENTSPREVVYKNVDGAHLAVAIFGLISGVVFGTMAIHEYSNYERTALFWYFVGCAVTFACYGTYYCFRARRIVTFSQEGITLSAGRRLLHHVRSEEVMFILGEIGPMRHTVPCVAVSTVPLEVVAQRWEDKLMRSSMSKHEVPFLKRSPKWRQKFAEEYIRKLVYWHATGCIKNGILLLCSTPRLQHILDEFYPQVQRIEV